MENAIYHPCAFVLVRCTLLQWSAYLTSVKETVSVAKGALSISRANRRAKANRVAEHG
jgi:hypothetical protein